MPRSKIIKKSVYRSLIIDNHVKNKKYGNFVSISNLTGKCAAQKLKKTVAVLVYGHIKKPKENHRFFDDFSLGMGL